MALSWEIFLTTATALLIAVAWYAWEHRHRHPRVVVPFDIAAIADDVSYDADDEDEGSDASA